MSKNNFVRDYILKKMTHKEYISDRDRFLTNIRRKLGKLQIEFNQKVKDLTPEQAYNQEHLKSMLLDLATKCVELRNKSVGDCFHQKALDEQIQEYYEIVEDSDIF